MLTSEQSISYAKVIPSAPQIFHGREGILSTLVTQLCTDDPSQPQSHFAILGTGGIGKTSLALSLIQDAAIVGFFGQDRRFFVSCESAATKAAFVASVADALGLESETPDVRGIIEALSTIPGRVLLVLDNLETPWEPSDSRADVEDVLSQLTSVPRLTLLVTLRGAERPSGVRWHRPFLPPLHSVDASAARQIFLSISDMPPANEDEEAVLAQLLEVLDNVPLAVTLMANLAQNNTYDELLQRWTGEKTSMLTRGFDSRLSSIDVSIQVSLSSPRLESLPLTQLVLQIISFLPDGVEQDELPKMIEADGRVPGFLAAISALRQAALIYHDKLVITYSPLTASTGPRLRLLSPIREYIRVHLPISEADIIPLRSYYIQLLQSRPSEPEALGDQQEVLRLRSQITNASTVLAEALSIPKPPAEAIECVVKLGAFSQISSASNVLLPLALEAAQRIGARRLEGQCVVMSYYRHGAQPLQQIQEARRVLAIADALPDDEPEKVKLKSRGFSILGDAYRRNGQKSKAIEVLQESLEMEVALQNYQRQVQIQYFMCNALEEEGDLISAMHVGLKATKLAEEHAEYPMSRAYSTAQLGKVYFKRGLFRRAEECYRIALKIQDDILVDSGPSAISLFCLGELYYAQGRILEAKPILEKAYQIQLKLGRADFASEAGLILGRVNLSLGNVDECLTKTHVCFRRFGECQWTEGQIECLMSLSQVERLRGNLVLARLHLEEARNLYRKERNIGTTGDADVMYEMGNVLSSGVEEMADDASKYFIISILIRSRRGGRLAVAECLKGLGDVALGQGRLADARSLYQTAVDLTYDTGARLQTGSCYLGLGDVTSRTSDKRARLESRAYYEKALKWYEEADDFWGKQMCRDRLSLIVPQESSEIS